MDCFRNLLFVYLAIILEATSDDSLHHVNITDEEKEKLKSNFSITSESSRPFLDMVLSSLDCNENDYLALLALCLIYALANNKGKRMLNYRSFLILNFILIFACPEMFSW